MSKARISLVFLLFFVWISQANLRPFSYQSNSGYLSGNSSVNHSAPAVPSPFGKISPLNGSINQPTNSLTLTWSASDPGITYQYCLRPNQKCPESKWVSVGTNTSVTISDLASNTNYYWQVRAVDALNNYTNADNNTWWGFKTVTTSTLPGAFTKLTPADAIPNQPVTGLVLSWSSSNLATSYRYCYDTVNDNICDTSWVSVTNLMATINDLAYDMQYYWQVVAVNTSGSVQADYSTWFSFHTQVAPPGSFEKTEPMNNSFDQPLALSLSWNASSGTGITYQYCVDTIPCTSSSDWLWAGTDTSASISNLSNAATYYWQVRAVNATAITYANGGEVWHFDTGFEPPPQPFVKLNPAGTNSILVPPNLTLQWSLSSSAARYFYCVDTTNHAAHDSSCGTGWVLNNLSLTSPHLNLNYNQTYYWQVYTENDQGIREADNGVWWSFTTIAAPPALFTKISPPHNTVDQPLTPWLYWWTPINPTNTYEYCIHASASCPEESWNPVAENDPIQIISPLSNNTAYFWQIRATSTGGTTYANSSGWSFTTLKSPPTSNDFAFRTYMNTPFSSTVDAHSNYAKVFELYGSLPKGKLDFHGDGIFTYTPFPNFLGEVAFQFIVSDGYNAPVGPYTVTIAVNRRQIYMPSITK